MKKVLKWIGIIFGSLIGLLLVIIASLYIRGNSLINKEYTFPIESINIPADAASIERGKHLANFLCSDCHGSNLGGVTGWFSNGALGMIDSANLTSGQGGVGQTYRSEEDYIRAIRHGIDPQGKPIYMPAVVALHHLSDEDLGGLIAYLGTIPPVDQITRGHERLTPLAKILIGAGRFTMQAEQVDHSNQHAATISASVSPDYGKYLVTISHCAECHGDHLSGGRHPDPSLTVFGPDLTREGELAGWTEEDFVHAMRTGNTPDGRQLNGYMPWPFIGRMTVDELRAIWLYLQSLPVTPSMD